MLHSSKPQTAAAAAAAGSSLASGKAAADDNDVSVRRYQALLACQFSRWTLVRNVTHIESTLSWNVPQCSGIPVQLCNRILTQFCSLISLKLNVVKVTTCDSSLLSIGPDFHLVRSFTSRFHSDILIASKQKRFPHRRVV